MQQDCGALCMLLARLLCVFLEQLGEPSQSERKLQTCRWLWPSHASGHWWVCVFPAAVRTLLLERVLGLIEIWVFSKFASTFKKERRKKIKKIASKAKSFPLTECIFTSWNSWMQVCWTVASLIVGERFRRLLSYVEVLCFSSDCCRNRYCCITSKRYVTNQNPFVWFTWYLCFYFFFSLSPFFPSGFTQFRVFQT